MGNTKVWGYVRVSTMKQKKERQKKNILDKYPDAYIVDEAYTGTKIDRPEFTKLLKAVRPGEVIVFDEVSRMSRNAAEGFALYQELFNKGVELIFLKEPHISTTTYKKALESNIGMTGTNIDYILKGVNEFLMALAREQIELAFEKAEEEVERLHTRTKEGLKQARLNGKQVGRAAGVKVETAKAKEAKEVIKKHSKDFGGSLTDPEVIKLAGISRNSYYKYKSEIRTA